MIDWYDLEKVIESEYSLPSMSLFDRHRKTPWPEARHMFYFICRKHLGWSITDCTRIRQDAHSTIIYATKKIETWVEHYPLVRGRYNRIYKQIRDQLPVSDLSSIH